MRGVGAIRRARASSSPRIPSRSGSCGELYLADLARRGRVEQLVAAARSLRAEDVGAMHLALWGRPLAALELAATARTTRRSSSYARVLACYRAGRADLAERVLADDPPPAEVVEDASCRAILPVSRPNEQWLVAHAPDARPALVALAGGLGAIAANAKPAPFDAEPDATSLEPFAALPRAARSRSSRARPCTSPASSSTWRRAALADASRRPARGSSARPFPGTDYYVRGARARRRSSQLERHGARRLDQELGL